jgi:hypothetical protein
METKNTTLVRKSLDRKDERALVEALRPVMAKANFKRRSSTWYRYAGALLHVFDLQAGANKERIYINLGLALRKVDKSTHPRVFDCSVYGRLNLILPERGDFEIVTDFADISLSKEQKVEKIAQYASAFALPFFDSFQTEKEIQEFVSSGRSRGFIKHSPKLLGHK